MNVQIRRCECGDRGPLGGSGANQTGAVISGAAAVVLRPHPLGPTIRSRPTDLNHDQGRLADRSRPG